MRQQKLKTLANTFTTAAAYAEDGAEKTAIEVALRGIFGPNKLPELEASKWAIGAVLDARHQQILAREATRDAEACEDDQRNGELAIAAAIYALPSSVLTLDLINRALMSDPPMLEDVLRDSTFDVSPKCSEFEFPEHGAQSVHERIDDLAEAAALIIAEMQRLIRQHLGGSAPAIHEEASS